MKKILLAVFAVVTFAVAVTPANAQYHRHHRHCFYKHHHRVCR